MTHPTPLEFARSYRARGWMPLPVPYRSKNPGFKGWEHFTTMEAELPTYFNGQPQNIGVLLGKLRAILWMSCSRRRASLQSAVS